MSRLNLTGNRLARSLVPALLLAAAGCEQPAVERVANAPPPVIVATPQGRVVHNPGAPERFLPRAGVPADPVFLFSGVLAVAIDSAGRQAVLPPSGDRVLLFDRSGRFLRSVGEGALARGIAVTSDRDGWVIVERDGGMIRIARTDSVSESDLAHAGSGPSPVSRAAVGLATVTRFGDRFVAARSPFASANFAEPSGGPLLLELRPDGGVFATIDTTRRLSDPTLTTIANAGHLAANDSLVFLAFLARDEIRAYDRNGRRRWTSDRALLWPRPPAGTGADPVHVTYQPVNLSIAVRGGVVYVLAFGDSAGHSMRIDAFDAETGVLQRTATLPAAPMLISLDQRGALWHAPAETLAVIGRPERTLVVDFALPTLRGDTLRLRSLRGKVVLLNFWASWCGPCREEFPLMARLSHELANEDFAVVAVSDDVDEQAAARFVGEFDPPFAIALARGALERTLNYRGLPFTALLDRDGRVVGRYIGFGGERQFDALRADVLRAIRAPAPSAAAKDARRE